MKISTVFLNWNRAVLLDKTLQSYFATVSEPYDAVVVDNGSTDSSLQIIARWQGQKPTLKSILLDDNIGGEAINIALDQLNGDLIHISENDQLFLPDWDRHARESFALFAELGQLSLFGAASTDEGSWYDNRVPLRHLNGKILYEEATGNVGASSVLRRTLIFDVGIRIHNIPQNKPGAFKFPDDGRLSREVRDAGYWCGWSDRYYVRNMGHDLAEFDRDPEYYEKNYASKPWVGLAGWRESVSTRRERPRPVRRSVVFPAAALQPELGSGTDDRPGQLWSMLDGCTAEAEVLDFLYALVRLVKPANAVETGTWLGWSATAIAAAMRDNGFGRVLTIEADPEIAELANQNLRRAGFAGRVAQILADTREFTPTETYQFAYFDTKPALAAAEFRRFYEHLEAGAIVVFHDVDGDAATDITALSQAGSLEGMFVATPRGLFVGRVRRP